MNRGNAPTENLDPIQGLFANLRVIKRRVKPHELTKSRNRHAIQATLIRGDSNVLLDGTSRITPELAQDIRLPFTTDHQYGQPQFVLWYEYHKSRADNTEYPEYLKDVLQADTSQEWDGFELVFSKVIGSGGYGLATLWNVNFEDDSTIQVVLKSNQDSNGPFERQTEEDWHNRYKDAAHTIQVVDLSDKVRTIREGLRQAGRPWKFYKPQKQFVPKHHNVVVLEYAALGSLYHCAARMYHSVSSLPDKQLWQLWECLVKGLATTSYTPTFIKAKKALILDSRDEEAEKEDFDVLLSKAEMSQDSRAFFHDLRKREETHDVHFDLDEQNILVSTDTSFNHQHNPFLKFNDFGMSQKMRVLWSKGERLFWNLRDPPKVDRAAPEQFHQDWDNVKLGDVYSSNFRSANLKQGYRIAGRYGSWTNVFLAGQIMEGLITGVRKTHPMKARDYVCTDSAFHGPAERRITYGHRLDSDEYARIDEQLRHTVMRCLSEAPIDRPKIVDLLEEVVRKKQDGFEESDDDTGIFWDNVLNGVDSNISYWSSQEALPSRKFKPARPRPAPNTRSIRLQSARRTPPRLKRTDPRRKQSIVHVGSAYRPLGAAAQAAAAMYPNNSCFGVSKPQKDVPNHMTILAQAAVDRVNSHFPGQDHGSFQGEHGIPNQSPEERSVVVHLGSEIDIYSDSLPKRSPQEAPPGAPSGAPARAPLQELSSRALRERTVREPLETTARASSGVSVGAPAGVSAGTASESPARTPSVASGASVRTPSGSPARIPSGASGVSGVSVGTPARTPSEASVRTPSGYPARISSGTSARTPSGASRASVGAPSGASAETASESPERTPSGASGASGASAGTSSEASGGTSSEASGGTSSEASAGTSSEASARTPLGASGASARTSAGPTSQTTARSNPRWQRQRLSESTSSGGPTRRLRPLRNAATTATNSVGDGVRSGRVERGQSRSRGSRGRRRRRGGRGG